MDMDTHPDPQPNPHHRKIDLQSSHDLTYLQINLANSALQKLDLHFPKISKPATHISLDPQPKKPTSTTKNPVEEDDDDNDDDPMRRRVHDLIHTFLLQTWTSAAHNVSVNGNNASTLPIPSTATLGPSPAVAGPSSSSSSQDPPLELEGIHYQHAPFDASLQHKLASLHGELESLTAQVSRLRRTAPATGAALQQESLRAALGADDARYDAEMEMDVESETRGLELRPVDREGWNDDVKEIYELGLRELAALAGVGPTRHGDGDGDIDGNGARKQPSLTETVGKAQRAVRVAMELE